VVGLLQRETAAESLVATVNDQRLKSDVTQLNPAAAEAILPVGGGAAGMRLVRPVSALKETVCVVRCRGLPLCRCLYCHAAEESAQSQIGAPCAYPSHLLPESHHRCAFPPCYVTTKQV
jgi:hypothetical protein